MEKLSFNVNNGEYEGPLDLILHLISKHQLNIIDINISDLLEQYMEQIREWQQRDLEVASEFLEMASRLVYIKTVSLLPKHEEEQEKVKAELVGQLLEYQACKEAAARLAERNSGFATFVREPQPIPTDLTYRRRHNVAVLTQHYWQAIGKGKRKLPPQSEVFSPLVARPFVSVSTKIIYLLRNLRKKTKINLDGLVKQSENRSEMVATFLAVLELIKAKRVVMDDNDRTLVFQGRKNSNRTDEVT